MNANNAQAPQAEPKAQPEGEKKPKKSLLSMEVSFGGVNDLAIALSIRHLSLMLKSGLSLSDALSTLTGPTTIPKLRAAYEQIAKDVDTGMNLADSMRKFPKMFSNIIISIVNVGEQGGTLEKNLIFLADYLKKDHELKKKVKGALLYPGIVFFLTIIEMVGVIFFILPKIEELFKSFANVPALTKNVIAGAAFIRTNWILVLLGVIILIVLFKLFLRTKQGKVFKDHFALRVPIINKLNRNNYIATFSRTLGILMESGMPLSKALDISADTIGNNIYAKALTETNLKVQDGQNLAACLTLYPKLFPPTFVKMIEVGEATGTLEENLDYLYDFHSEEVQDMANNLTTLLEPLLLIFIGAMIGFLALIIVTPIYQLTGSINEV